MAKPLRYTGDWPPPEVLSQYPNWVFAYDEEDEDDHDETTLKPEDQQALISAETQITAATLLLANGTSLPGIVCIDKGTPVGVSAFEKRWTWSIWREHKTSLWRPATQNYLPEDQRLPSVLLSDTQVFPLRFSTSLPRASDEPPWRLEIRSDGSTAEF